MKAQHRLALALSGIMLVGIAFLIVAFLPLVESILLLAGVVIPIALLAFFVIAYKENSKTPQGKRLKYQRLSKKDPKAALQARLTDMRDQLRDIGRQIGKIRTDRRQIIKFQNENTGLIKKAQEQLQANPTTQDGKAAFWVKRIRRFTEHNKRLDSLDLSLEKVQIVLERMYTNGEMIYDDVRHAAQLSMIEYDAIQSAHEAARLAQSFTGADKSLKIQFQSVIGDLDVYLDELNQVLNVSNELVDDISLLPDQGEQVLELQPLEELERNTQLLNSNTIKLFSELNQEQQQEKLSDPYLDLLD